MVVRHARLLALIACILSFHSAALAQSALPPNLHVSPIYQAFVESMADRSPTFRAQLSRVANAPHVMVYLTVVLRMTGARAVTQIERHSDGLTARIQVARFDDMVELIAHEIEHVIEQLEGVDLAGRAGTAEAGIYTVSFNGAAFETERAARAGVVVAREVSAFKRRNSGI